MARKRVSLKDKGPETLGTTEKKGQGIDVLFGGPSASRTRVPSTPVAAESKTNQPTAKEINMATKNKDALTNSGANVAAAPESLPVNEADNDLTLVSSAETDELGLPVAMAAPPSRLLVNRMANVEVDELGLPVAMETPPTDLTIPVSPSPAPPPTSINATVTPDLTPSPPAASTDTNFSSFVDDNDLSGLVGEETVSTPLPPVPEAVPVAAPIESAPFAVPESTPVMPVEPAPVATPVDTFSPPVATLPIQTPVDRPLPQSPPPEATYTPPTYVPPPTPVVMPAPVPVTPPPPPPVIESFGGLITVPMTIKPENLLPQDYQYTTGTLQLAERAKVEKDDLLSEKVERYLGKERREALDKEIERLYNVVSQELSDNNEDVSFALKALREAQDIVLEDIRQYDEALYRVALVKTMLVRRNNLKRWSYTWGIFVFFYAMTWLAFFITAIVFTSRINFVVVNAAGQSGGLAAASTAWYSALAGGIGGVIGILYSLYWRVAFKQDFDRQYLMYYLVQPIMGFMLGAVTHLIITAGFLTVNGTGGLASQITVILQMVIGFVAGFRQRLVYAMIEKIVQKIAPEESDKSPTNVVPEQ